MKRKTKLAIAGAVVVVVGYALYKYLTPQGTTPEADEPSPETGGETDNGGGFISNIVEDVFGLTNDDEAELTDTPTADLTGTTGGSSGGTTPPPSPPSSGSGYCAVTNLDSLEPLPGSLNCTAGYTNSSQCQTGGICIPGWLDTPTNACGAGVARWQVLLNKHYKSAGDGQCIPTEDLGKSTPQTNQKTQELIASGAISVS